MKKAKGVFVTQEESKPVRIGLSQDGEGDAEMFVYGSDLESTKTAIEHAFGVKKAKIDALWPVEAKKRGRPSKKSEELVTA